ncbi:DUF5050 domain-containing protein [Candidatus Saccharibacteria bacterium]|nr:DUF5050 domain-containing protein [Candidatus Saccharibacteria bacterium]
MADKPEQKTDVEQAKAEKHVEKIMGPAQSVDGEKPEPSSDSPLFAQETEVTETTEAPADTAPEVPSDDTPKEEAVEPAEDAAETEDSDSDSSVAAAAAAANAELEAQMAGSVTAEMPEVAEENMPGTMNEDLDMAKPPEDFSNTVEADVAESPETDQAVDDILRTDADASLPDTKEEDAVVMKASLWERTKNGWANWWSNPWKRYGTLAALLVLLLVIFLVAPVRAMVLNAFGVRSSVTVSVLDGANNLPLQNAVIEVDGVSTKTNADGKATLKGIHLGKQDVEVKKIAFTTYKKEVDFGMRIVDLGEVTLKPAGVQLTYVFSDYLSGKPVQDVELQSGESTAKSDKNGKAIITVQPDDTNDIKISAKKKGYRTDELSAPADLTATTQHQLVSGNKAVFVSKESGTYDIYKMYIDGTDREVLLAGTGRENQATTALPSPNGGKVAVASTRDDKRNADGYLLTALNVVDTETGEATNIEYAEQITLLGWRGETLVYEQTVAGTSAANPSRQKIIAYDFADNKRFQLANANYFTGVQLVGDVLYYTVSSNDPNAKVTFARVNIDGTNKKTLYTDTIWTLLRTAYDKMKFQAPDNSWYEYTIGSSSPTKSTPVSDWSSRYYVDAPTSKLSAWVDVRDNNGVLMRYDIAGNKDTELTTQRDMQSVVYWLNDTDVVYRVAGSREVADYVVSVNGGAPKKISDVTLSGIR